MKQLSEEFDTFSCGGCYLPYSNDNPALILKCSHTYCKNCIDRYGKKCLLCQDKKNEEENKTAIYCNNKIINNIVELCNLFNLDIDCFLSFPLSFKYCENCSYFITNYSFNYHKLSKHKLINYDRKLKMFLEKNSKNIYEDKNKFMYYLLYYYQSPFLPIFKFIDIKKRISFNNGEFIFYGQFLNSNESAFIFNLYEENKSSHTDKWHKGIMFNKANGLIIHGYFCFRFKNSSTFLVHKIFGLLSYNNIKFFGFIKIKGQMININEKICINDFKLDCGLLYDNNEYSFGEFKESEVTNYLSNQIGKKAGIEKLINGEIIIVKEEGVDIKRIYTSLNKKNEKIEIPIEQMNENIEIFEINGTVKFQEKKSKEYLTLVPLKNNNGNNIEDLCLSECKIKISKNNKVIIFSSDKDDSIIVLNPFKGTINFTTISEEGFLIIFKDSELSKLKSLKSSKIKNLKENKNNFFENINQLFETEIKNCIIKYYIYEINGNIIKQLNQKYFEISPDFVKKIDKRNKRNKEKIYKYNISKKNLEELFEGKLDDILNFSIIEQETIYCK